MIILRRTTSNDKNFYTLAKDLDKDLRSRYGDSQDVFDEFNVIKNLETVVIAFDQNKPVGCGCFKILENDTVELKRMFVDEGHRFKGIGVAILNELENWAREIGFNSIVLETGIFQPEAIKLYEKNGYQIIPNYFPYEGNELSICMKKSLI